MYKLTGIFLMFLISLFISPVSATIFSQDGSNMTEAALYMLTNNTAPIANNQSIEFFYDPECGACTPTHEYMEQYLSEHPGTNVTMVNLSSGPEAQDLLNERYIAYHREFLNIPVVFVGPIGLEGTKEIISNFEGVYHWYTKSQ